jgi:protein-disulfide isomerase
MAQQIGVQGVPFFVFDNKYAVSAPACGDSWKPLEKAYGKKELQRS